MGTKRKTLFVALWFVAGATVGPIMLSAIFALTGQPFEQGFPSIDHSASDLRAAFDKRQPLVMSSMVDDTDDLIANCGRNPTVTSSILALHDDPDADGPYGEHWSPARGFWMLQLDLHAVDQEEEAEQRDAYLTTHTSRFERRFLNSCIDATAARPLCLAQVDAPLKGTITRDTEIEKLYATIRGNHQKLICAYLDGVAPRPASSH